MLWCIMIKFVSQSSLWLQVALSMVGKFGLSLYGLVELDCDWLANCSNWFLRFISEIKTNVEKAEETRSNLRRNQMEIEGNEKGLTDLIWKRIHEIMAAWNIHNDYQIEQPPMRSLWWQQKKQVKCWQWCALSIC